MKRIILFLLLAYSGLSYGQGLPLVGYTVPTITAMKAYFGSANRMHVDATNADYDACPGCTADEVNIFAGAGSRKWKRVTSRLNADSLQPGSTNTPFKKADSTKLAAISGSNTGDETLTSIKAKLGITVLGGSNTGDQDLSPYATTTTVNTALALKAALASPTFTGAPLAPTASPGTNTTQIATTAFVAAAVSASTTGVASFNGRTGTVVPVTGDYTASQVTGAAPTASPGLTGTPTAPTAAAGTNTTQLATTAFATTADNLKVNILDTAAMLLNYKGAIATNTGAIAGKQNLITTGTTSQYLRGDLSLATFPTTSGTVTTLSVTSANGVSGSVANATSTPAITLSLGAITPTSVVASGSVTGSNLSGTNTGNETTTSINTLYGYTPANPASVVPTSRTITINGTALDLSANRSFTVSGGISSSDTTNKWVQDMGLNSTGDSLFKYKNGTRTAQPIQISLFTDTTIAGSGTLIAPIRVDTLLWIATKDKVKKDSMALATAIAAKGVGTVTTASVVSANGFAGTVANATSTPAITLSTSITGLLKGNGTAISAATSGTDYSSGTSALATGILKSTTTTGGLSIAIAADFPTLNQSTTGSAATLTTPRSIYGNNFDGSAALSGIIGSAFGGTNNGFTAFTGPTTSAKTFTLPNASATILTDNTAVTGAQGGTGVSNSGKTITLGGNLTTSGAFATTFTSTATTSVTLPPSGTLLTASDITFAKNATKDSLILTVGGTRIAAKDSTGSGGTSYTISTGLSNTSGTLTNDLSTGKSGGQTVIGGTASGDGLTLSTTSNATKGDLTVNATKALLTSGTATATLTPITNSTFLSVPSLVTWDPAAASVPSATSVWIAGSLQFAGVWGNGSQFDRSMALGSFGLDMNSAQKIRFYNGFLTGTADGGIARNGAGILEINTGTAGTFADLKLKSLTSSGGMTFNRTTVANTAYTLLVTDFLVAYTSLSATRAVTAASSPVAGQTWVIKDEAGTAGTNAITFVGTLDGASNPTLVNTNYGSKTIYYNGTAWFSR